MYLEAINTGHGGSVSTIHAETAQSTYVLGIVGLGA